MHYSLTVVVTAAEAETLSHSMVQMSSSTKLSIHIAQKSRLCLRGRRDHLFVASDRLLFTTQMRRLT